MPFENKENTKGEGKWTRRQIESVVDISCPEWLDWFHGGLNTHSPHHIFPRICRCHYRRVHKDVIELCKKHNVKLNIMPWTYAVKKTIKHMSTMKEVYHEM